MIGMYDGGVRTVGPQQVIVRLGQAHVRLVVVVVVVLVVAVEVVVLPMDMWVLVTLDVVDERKRIRGQGGVGMMLG